jgi:hypothetical protein
MKFIIAQFEFQSPTHLHSSRECSSLGVDAGEAFAGSKVGNFDDAAVRVNENVVAFDVAMHNLLIVKVLQALQDLLAVVRDGAFVVLQRTPF